MTKNIIFFCCFFGCASRCVKATKKMMGCGCVAVKRQESKVDADTAEYESEVKKMKLGSVRRVSQPPGRGVGG